MIIFFQENFLIDLHLKNSRHVIYLEEWDLAIINVEKILGAELIIYVKKSHHHFGSFSTTLHMFSEKFQELPMFLLSVKIPLLWDNHLFERTFRSIGGPNSGASSHSQTTWDLTNWRDHQRGISIYILRFKVILRFFLTGNIYLYL